MTLLADLSASLRIPASYIEGLAAKADHAYYEFTIRKASGGLRHISHPSRELKALQRWLQHNLIDTWPVHECAFAYRRGVGIRSHAAVHARSRYLLRLDTVDFFPSIGWRDVGEYLSSLPRGTENWTAEDRRLFGRLVCRKAQLTIGAPSSPGLSNALCFELDKQLVALAAEVGALYSRYADDLFFSAVERDCLWEVPDRVSALLDALDCPGNLRLNPAKTRHSSKKGRRQVTGLVLSSDDTVRIGRHRKRFIRGLIHRWGTLSGEERSHLAGLLAFAIDVEPDFLNALVLKYGHERVRQAQLGRVIT